MKLFPHPKRALAALMFILATAATAAVIYVYNKDAYAVVYLPFIVFAGIQFDHYARTGKWISFGNGQDYEAMFNDDDQDGPNPYIGDYVSMRSSIERDAYKPKVSGHFWCGRALQADESRKASVTPSLPGNGSRKDTSGSRSG